MTWMRKASESRGERGWRGRWRGAGRPGCSRDAAGSRLPAGGRRRGGGRDRKDRGASAAAAARTRFAVRFLTFWGSPPGRGGCTPSRGSTGVRQNFRLGGSGEGLGGGGGSVADSSRNLAVCFLLSVVNVRRPKIICFLYFCLLLVNHHLDGPTSWKHSINGGSGS